MESSFYTTEDKISYFCSEEYSFFLNKKNVIGVGLGYKIQNGFNTCKKCINVFVSRKMDLAKLCKNDIVPKLYKGMLTDVVETGYMHTMALREKVRPTICGYCMGPVGFNNTVTLGCIVKDNNQRYILTCGHSTICSDCPISAKIIQPSSKYGGLPIIDAIGQVKKYIPAKPITLFKTPKNIVDAAMLSIYNNDDVSNKIYYIGNLTGTTPAILNEFVFKSGSATSYTAGIITNINCTIEILNEGKRYLLTDQIITTDMANDGDSGAIAVSQNNKAVGLLTGGSEVRTIYNKIDNVLKALDVKIE